jgi:hypothetical protein
MRTDWTVSRGSVWSNRLRIKMLASPRGSRGSSGSWVRLVLQYMATAPGFENGDVAITIVTEAVGAVRFLFAENSSASLDYPSRPVVDSNVLSRFPGFCLHRAVPVLKR